MEGMSVDDELEQLRARRLQEMMQGAQVPAKAEGGGEVVVATDADFAELIKTHDAVVVDCWAAWCGPCRWFAPIFEATAKEYAGRATFAKLDTDANPQTSGAFRIMSIPTLLIFRGGRLVYQQPGALPQPMLRQVVEAHLG